jgi:hypothetical protein
MSESNVSGNGERVFRIHATQTMFDERVERMEVPILAASESHAVYLFWNSQAPRTSLVRAMEIIAVVRDE